MKAIKSHVPFARRHGLSLLLAVNSPWQRLRDDPRGWIPRPP